MSIYEAMQDGLCGFFKFANDEETAGEEDEKNPEADEEIGDADPHNSMEETDEWGEDVVWHASDKDFDQFIFKEIGFHFAETRELAENAAQLNGKPNATARPYRITATNMVEVTGQKNGFIGYNLLDDMLARGHITKMQRDEAYNALYDFEENYEEYEDREIEKMEARGYYLPFDTYKQAEANVLRNYFNEWGIDGLKYWNSFDAYGMASVFGDQFTKDLGGVQPNWSYIVFDNDQIIPLS